MLKAIKANANDWRLFSTSDKKCFHHFLPNDDDDFDDDGSDDDEELKLFDVDANGRMTQNGTSIATLSEQAQLLFVRLFQRKHRWLRRDQIKYEVIFSSLFAVTFVKILKTIMIPISVVSYLRQLMKIWVMH